MINQIIFLIFCWFVVKKIKNIILVNHFLQSSDKVCFLVSHLREIIKLKYCKELLLCVDFNDHLYLHLINQYMYYANGILFGINPAYFYMRAIKKLLIIGIDYLPSNNKNCVDLFTIMDANGISIEKDIFNYYVKDYLLHNTDNCLSLKYNENFAEFYTIEELEQFVLEHIEDIHEYFIENVFDKELADKLIMIKNLTQ